MKIYVKNYINSIESGLNNSQYKIDGVEKAAELFFEELNTITKKVKLNKGRLFFFGNGASAAFSNHMALDWSKNGGILALCLSDSAMLTALANDYDFEGCFLEFLKIYSPTPNDLVITTSSSGNSKNVVNVLEFCKENDIPTFGLSGLNEGNKTEKLSKFSLFVPMKTYGMVECIHQVFHHVFLDKFMEIEEWKKMESQNMDSNNFKL
jgi:D-sedoheptulose 7-phosphate isomerase